jgi:predicted DNA-binding protein (UPF0251 family)
MPRPQKCRRVEFLPNTTYFKPAGIPLSNLEEVCMSIEEVEAIRLKDLEGLEQEAGAEKMNISRPTFQRMLASAHRKVADAILNGKAIKIDGGNFEMTRRRFRSHRGHERELEMPISALPESCPECHEPNIEPIAPTDSTSGIETVIGMEEKR